MSERVTSAVRQLDDPHERQNAIKYSREIFKRAAQGFYMSNGEKFDLMIECLHTAGFRLEADYVAAFPDNTLDLFETEEP